MKGVSPTTGRLEISFFLPRYRAARSAPEGVRKKRVRVWPGFKRRNDHVRILQ
jgi:hypothetical protein